MLVVEDSVEDEHFLRDLLEEAAEARARRQWMAWEIVFAVTAAEACDLAIDGGFDAILLNLRLPDSPVLHETYASVFSVAARTPILVLADEADDSLEALLLREGAQDFLVKSELDAAPLAHRLKQAVERQRYVNGLKKDTWPGIPLPHVQHGAVGCVLPLDLAIGDISVAERGPNAS